MSNRRQLRKRQLAKAIIANYFDSLAGRLKTFKHIGPNRLSGTFKRFQVWKFDPHNSQPLSIYNNGSVWHLFHLLYTAVTRTPQKQTKKRHDEYHLIEDPIVKYYFSRFDVFSDIILR